MDKVRALMFKVNKLKYKKNESYEPPKEIIKRNQDFYCIFKAYDKKTKVQDTEFILEVSGNQTHEPYGLDMSMEIMFKGIGDIDREGVRNHILEKRVYDYVIPYMRTRILELTMYGDGAQPYDMAYENLRVQVIDQRQGLMDRFRRVFKL